MPSSGKFRPSGIVLIAVGALMGLGLIAFGILRLSANSAPAELPGVQPDRRVTHLVTAARPVERGHLIEPADLKTTPVLGPVPEGAIVAPRDAVGKVAIVDIQPQQLVLASLVSTDPAAAGLAMLVPVGQRVISIDTTDEIAVGGFLRPGDSVDVEIVLPNDVFGGTADGQDRSEARTLLQNIKVVTVGPTLGGPDDKSAGANDKPVAESRTLTLAMEPDQVGPFTLARKLGRFYLLLRNPNDRAVIAGRRSGLASVRGGEAPRPAAASSAVAPRRPAATRPVELIVGGQRQIIYPGTSGR